MDHFRISLPINPVSLGQMVTIWDQFTINTVNVVSVGSHDGATSEVKNGTDDGTDDEKPSSSDAVDER